MVDIAEYFKAIEGVDENGEPKAVATLQNQAFTADALGHVTNRVIDEASTTSAEVRFVLSNGIVVVALTFEDFDDIEYIRMKAVCEDFLRKTNPTEIRHLVLTLTDAGVFEHFVTAITMTHVIDTNVPRIRFLCKSGDVSAYCIRAEDRQEVVDAMEEQQQRSMAEAFR